MANTFNILGAIQAAGGLPVRGGQALQASLQQAGQGLAKKAAEEKKRQKDFQNLVEVAKLKNKFSLEKIQQQSDMVKQINESLMGKGQQGQEQQRPNPMQQVPQREPVISLSQGGFGDVQERPTLGQFGKLQQPQQPQQQRQQPPFIMSPSGRMMKNPFHIFETPLNKLKREKLERETETILPDEQDVQARALARRIGGVKGAKEVFPTIARLMKKGKSIDEIEDIIRFNRQSEQFTGAIRSAAQEVLINTSSSVAERTLDFMDDELSKGNITGVKSKLKRIARKTAGTEESRKIMGKERTVEFLGEIQNELNELERAGVSTNIFTGTIEEISKKIGTVKDSRLRKIATKIKVGIMNYRRAMSGAAFSVPESAEYTAVFPGIDKTAAFNTATLSALIETFNGDLDSFYSLSMGEENYRDLFNKPKAPQSENIGQNQQSQPLQERKTQNKTLSTSGVTPSGNIFRRAQ